MTNINKVEEIITATVNKISNETDLSEYQSGSKFEKLVFEIMKDLAENKGLTIYNTGQQTFPDIVIEDTYGVEVKFSKNKKWQSVGNSIFEGTLDRKVTDQIFLLFGKKVGKRIQARYKKYEEVLADIKVTHSPRFYIDMDVSKNETIFEKIEYEYNDFKYLPPNKKAKIIKQFVKSNLDDGEELWWLDSENEEVMEPKIKLFNTLSNEEKLDVISECMTLFHELFKNSYNKKYERTAIYLLKKYQIVSSSLRDNFSAKGKENIKIKGNTYRLSRIYKNLFDLAGQVQNHIMNFDLKELERYWDVDNIPDRKTALFIWKQKLNEVGDNKDMHGEIQPSDIFDEGLKNERGWDKTSLLYEKTD